MSVEAGVIPKMLDDEDDDGPVVFKRRDTSKTSQSNSEIKKISVSRPDKQPVKQASNVHTPNDGASGCPKGKVFQSTKALSSKPPVAIQKSQMSSSKASPVKSPPTNSASSSHDQPKKHSIVKEISPSRASPVKSPLVNSASSMHKQAKKHSTAKEEKPSDSESEDSEDDKPLIVRFSAGLSKLSPNLAERGQITNPGPLQPPKGILRAFKSPDDSDDEKPLSSKFQMKTNGGSSSGKIYHPDEDITLASKLQQNGSVKRDSQVMKTSSKRPAAEISSCQSSVKKPKLSGASPPAKAKQLSAKAEPEDENDHIPIAQRMKKATPGISVTVKKKTDKTIASSLKKDKKKQKKVIKKSKYSKSSKVPPGSGEGQKWTTLVHSGVIFPPPYKPHGIKMLYDGRPVDLTPVQEEVATMYAVMLETDYVQKSKFNENFFNDWKKILGKNHIIQDLKKCDFTPIHQWHLTEKEKKKQMSSEEKKALKEEKLKLEEKYMWAIVDGVKEKVGNFRVEPPGLFRGRGEHPKMGKLKKRIYPSDITINIGKDAPIPECPIPDQRWKEVRHDNTVTWLAFWNDPINPKEFKYVFLAASSTLKGQSDKEKYEKARMLKDYIQDIRVTYTKNFSSKDMTKRQIAVATYLIDKLALRAGNEKDDDEADTVGCCTLKVENVKPIPPNILEFDFLGKDSIKYHKQFEADPLVFKAVEQFRQGKRGSDDLFDKLDTSKLNAHLKELMTGLTAKVFRTYNASITLDDMLSKETSEGDVPQKVLIYQQANKEVAIICNHQRTVSKSHNAQMERLTEKINELKGVLGELETDLARTKKGKSPLKDTGKRSRNLSSEALAKKIVQTNAKIEKMESDMKAKEDLKEIALGTSKINYLDPRITVAWCKRNEVPIEKIFNKSLLAKFAWAMDADPSFRF
ncbi:hypothetical protein Nepgr_010737 [Nepenthes gracilis]|uniref:DNA topoisomerase I n=1 Tax=Nepenthes gracilis TaxID=150966 RepID=A0AAD3SE03_NEPGR|nr:hypothetical protein Nepgr_010737 [Nepenthes gracilis]